jgi:hypothetical protein
MGENGEKMLHPQTWWTGMAGRSEHRLGVEVRFYDPVHTGTRAHPASYTMGTGSFPGVKRPRPVVKNPLTSNTEVKERVELYLYSPLCPYGRL